MIAVKDPSGKTLARSMFRLLWHKSDEKPVLFLDRLYPSPCSEERKEAILLAAKECAKKLNCELYSQWEEARGAEKEIFSLGSSCPYEYADAAEGVMKDGVFKVKAKRVIL